MKLENIVLGRAIRTIRIVGRPGGLYMLDAIKPLQERYGFLKVPTTLEDYNETQGVKFYHGKFREIVIDSFHVYSNGILVDTRSDTNDADSFLEDVLAWGAKTYGARIPENQQTEKVYVSNLEISLGKPLKSFLPSADLLGGEISKHLKKYGLKHEPYEPTGITLNFDRMSLNSLVTFFSLQRREGVPFSSGVYFSSAPLKTADHIALLEKLEREA